jgi:hypothetical protein
MGMNKFPLTLTNTKIFIFIYTGINGWIPKDRTISSSTFLQEISPPLKESTKTSNPISQEIPLPPPPQKIVTEDTAMTETQLFNKLKHQLTSDETFPEEVPIQDTVGEFKLMQPRFQALEHAAAPLLLNYATNGCPVDCGPDWTQTQVEDLINRGSHKSAYDKDAIKQLRTETQEKIEQSYARVLSYGEIKKNFPKRLKISPAAMIPHKSKKFRCILDLSFKLRLNGKVYNSVNETTNKKSKQESMVQLGQSLRRIIAAMADNFDASRPFFFSKLDIKDGFWRMAVSDDDAWNFCYVLPSIIPARSIDDIQIVIPNSLQMGWCESPPFFCSASETARDVMETLFIKESLEQHKFEHIMLQNINPNERHVYKKLTTILEVFVDDFIGVINTNDYPTLLHLSRAMLHGVHSCFPPPTVTKHMGGDPISEKKLHQGDGTWDTEKEILGWILNGKDYTVHLPVKKCETIRQLIRSMLKKNKCSLHTYQVLAGKLQHASFGLPGGAGLFSPIQMAMTNNPPYITLTSDLKQILQDWRYIIRYMEKNPTSVRQLVLEFPAFVGYSDACRLGAGGVWCSGTSELSPVLWQVAWPDDVQNALVTDDNPSGSITINDLELAGAVLNWLVLEGQQVDLQYKHVGTFCDNTSAVAWAYKLRTSSSKVAGRLLRMLGMRIHARQASGLTPLHIAGEENVMADIISRAFKNGKFFHASENLTCFFNKHFPLQKNKSWRDFRLPKELVSRVTACLRGEPLQMASLLRLPKIGQNTGSTGTTTHECARLTHSSPTSNPSNEISSSMHMLQGSGQALTAEALRSGFKGSRMRSRPSPRPLNWLENKVPCTGSRESTT